MADNVETIGVAYEAFGRADIPAVIAVFDEQIDWNVPEAVPHGGSFRGHEEVGQFFQGIGEEWEDFSIELDDGPVAAGNHVIAIGRASGKLRDGGEASYGFVHVFTFDDGSDTPTRFREFVEPDSTLLARAAG